MRGRAGHQVQRHAHVRGGCAGHDFFDQDLEQRSAGNGPDREHALGLIESQPGPLPSGNQNHADPAGGERFLPAPLGLFGRDFAAGGLQADGRRRGGARGQRRPVLAAARGARQLVDQGQVERFDLGRQHVALPLVELVPKREHVLLVARREPLV